MIDNIKGIIEQSILTEEDKKEMLDYLEELIDKAWKYDELSK